MSNEKVLTVRSSKEIPDALWTSKPFLVRIRKIWYRVADINVIDFLITLEELTDQEFVDLVAKEI